MNHQTLINSPGLGLGRVRASTMWFWYLSLWGLGSAKRRQRPYGVRPISLGRSDFTKHRQLNNSTFLELLGTGNGLLLVLVPHPMSKHFLLGNNKILADFPENLLNSIFFVFTSLYKAKWGLGIAKRMPKTIRTHYDEFGDHLTLLDIGNSRIVL